MTGPSDALHAAGVTGWLHAVDLDSGAEVGVAADQPVVAASVFKVPILVELCCRYTEGDLDPRQRVRVGADERRTPGGTGLSEFCDAVDVSLRDLSLLMMSVSDNRATDLVLDLVGRERVNRRMAQAGLTGTYLEADCAGLFAAMDEDVGGSFERYLMGDPRGSLLWGMRTVDPSRTNRTTPRETTRLLGMLWGEEHFPAGACAEARRILARQVWPHRLGAGFPEPEARVSGKTGTLAFLRSEAGVVELAGGRFAVAVFVASHTAAPRNPVADAAIGAAARSAVDELLALRPTT